MARLPLLSSAPSSGNIRDLAFPGCRLRTVSWASCLFILGTYNKAIAEQHCNTKCARTENSPKLDFHTRQIAEQVFVWCAPTQFYCASDAAKAKKTG